MKTLIDIAFAVYWAVAIYGAVTLISWTKPFLVRTTSTVLPIWAGALAAGALIVFWFN